jgi:hypothetical protein
VIGGVTGWDALGPRAIETIVWVCLAFAVLAGDIVLQWQDLRRTRPALPKSSVTVSVEAAAVGEPVVSA